MNPVFWSMATGIVATGDGGDLLGGLLLTTVVVGGSIYLFYLAYTALWRRRLMENVPTSKCAGITVGLNELKGKALSRQPMRSYLTEKDVVYYRYTIEEEWKRSKVDGKGKTKTETGWETIKSGEQRPRFTLRDETGEVRIDPEKAEVEGARVLSKTCRRGDPLYYGKGPAKGVRGSTGHRRFREFVIENGQDIYLIGPARMRDDIVALEIAYDEMEPLYLISTRSEEKILSSYGWRMVVSLFFSVVLAILTPMIINVGFTTDALIDSVVVMGGVMILSGIMVLGLFFALYFKTVFDGLVYVRNRVDRAWSMIDVELKRRRDLIPNLVEVVQGQIRHEKGAQEAVVRARQMLTNGGEGMQEVFEQQTRALGLLFAVAERYPRIMSDGSFYKLMEELTRCEEKIALARNGYNDSVEALNNRVETIPDMFVAPLARVEKRQLLGAMEFEKKPIEIQFTEEPDPVIASELVPESAESVG